MKSWFQLFKAARMARGSYWRDPFTASDCKSFEPLGSTSNLLMDGLRKESYYVVAETVLRDYIFVHLDDNYDKFNLLIFMLQKLFSLIDQTSVPDNPDSLQNQEI
ncbi:hypothetical protein Patl1_05688 [Pistacia atlantica]|uniref:Uncharacterized protein n=1 Tax=Pistacia atlantica TaxID=434234 RepID=A0ACC1BVW6_9ROSI|nr:hypothetical protein Patl1_05688 [Pistacia atlantica]